jgi:hypothetical protein
MDFLKDLPPKEKLIYGTAFLCASYVLFSSAKYVTLSAGIGSITFGTKSGNKIYLTRQEINDQYLKNPLNFRAGIPSVTSGDKSVVFNKGGNNGSISCQNYCSNVGGSWGPTYEKAVYAYSTSRRELDPLNRTQYETKTLPNNSPADNLVCGCSDWQSGAIPPEVVKGPPGPNPYSTPIMGNNGTVSGDEFCARSKKRGLYVKKYEIRPAGKECNPFAPDQCKDLPEREVITNYESSAVPGLDAKPTTTFATYCY